MKSFVTTIKFYMENDGTDKIWIFYPSLNLYFFNDIDMALPARKL